MTRIIVAASLVAVLGGALVGGLAATWRPWFALGVFVLLGVAAVLVAVRLDRVLTREPRTADVVRLPLRTGRAGVAEVETARVVAPETPSADSAPRPDRRPAEPRLGDGRLALRRGA